ncbi:hypothetical protein ACFQE0_20755 [Methylobacterium komagatae]|uniref:Uncharacterized protein n=1 Tax=Methylobacterium komagatae TaxID=374425 RepID=A0ABW2BMX4_9HYPH
MRSPAFLLVLVALTGSASAAPADPQALELAWHRCLREAIAHQPTGQSRAGNERNALDECKEREDAYVAALMGGRPQSMWAWAWTTLTEPLSSWVSLLRR